MADQELPLTGKDVSVSISIGGRAVRAVKATSITEDAVYADVEHKPLGTSRVYHDAIHEGWSGTIEFEVSAATLDEMIDEVHAAQRARIPVSIGIKVKRRYRDGSTKAYLYRNCKLGFSQSIRRGEAGTISMPWRTGEDRIAQ